MSTICCGLLESLYSALAFVFNSLQPLVPKTGGGYTPSKAPLWNQHITGSFFWLCLQTSYSPTDDGLGTPAIASPGVLDSRFGTIPPSGNTVPLLLQCCIAICNFCGFYCVLVYGCAETRADERAR